MFFPVGQYLISSTLLISAPGVSLLGTTGVAIWNQATNIYQKGSVIVKKSTMTTPAIKISSGLRNYLTDIGVAGQVGNTGDGIYLEDGQHVVFRCVSVSRVGGNGIRLGSTGAASNCNGWQFESVTSEYNGGHGVYIYDQYAPTAPNANAGNVSGLTVLGNAGDGLRIINGLFNNISGLWSEQNTGYGVSLLGLLNVNLYTNIFLSDVEGNVAGQWNIGPDTKHVNIIGGAVHVPSTVDPESQFISVITGGTSKFRGIQFASADSVLSYYKEATWVPTDTSGAALSLTLTQCKYTRVGNIVTCSGRITYPTTANTNQAQFSVPVNGNIGSFSISSNYASAVFGYVAGTNAYVYGAGGTTVTNANLSGKELNITVTYLAA